MSNRTLPVIHRVKIVNVRPKIHARPDVSDHAIVRYLERKEKAFGLIANARLALSSSAVQRAILERASAVQIDGMKFVLRGNRVVTVLDRHQQMRRHERCRVFRSFSELTAI